MEQSGSEEQGGAGMAVFTPAEIAYLQSQMLGRIASVGRDGQPHVVPVAFRYNADLDTIDVGGHGFARRKKFRDVRRNPRVAFVVDDVPSTDPWTPRGIEVRGEAKISDTGGKEIMPDFDHEMFRIRARRIVSWGIEGERWAVNARSVT
jgi:pyridoxamine 5'-phosphate oxidase family protein